MSKTFTATTIRLAARSSSPTIVQILEDEKRYPNEIHIDIKTYNIQQSISVVIHQPATDNNITIKMN